MVTERCFFGAKTEEKASCWLFDITRSFGQKSVTGGELVVTRQRKQGTDQGRAENKKEKLTSLSAPSPAAVVQRNPDKWRWVRCRMEVSALQCARIFVPAINFYHVSLLSITLIYIKCTNQLLG